MSRIRVPEAFASGKGLFSWIVGGTLSLPLYPRMVKVGGCLGSYPSRSNHPQVVISRWQFGFSQVNSVVGAQYSGSAPSAPGSGVSVGRLAHEDHMVVGIRFCSTS